MILGRGVEVTGKLLGVDMVFEVMEELVSDREGLSRESEGL